MNESLGTDIYDSTENIEMHETMNNTDRYRDYNEIRTNNTPTPETSEDTPKQSKESMTDEYETTIATTATEKNEATTTNETRTSRPRSTRHLQDNIWWTLIMGEFKSLKVGRNDVTSSVKLTHFRSSAINTWHAHTHTHIDRCQTFEIKFSCYPVTIDLTCFILAWPTQCYPL